MSNTLADLVDSAVSAPVIVYGSLPPLGHDLDLFVRLAQLSELTLALTELGFSRHGRTWWRVTGAGVDAVDLRTADDWALPPAEVDALFDQGLPLQDQPRLLRPAPPHALLLLARRTAGGARVLDDQRRARLERALAEDAGAWDAARSRAAAWGSLRALELLRRASQGRPITSLAVVAARAERLRAAGDPAPVAWARAVRAVATGPARGAVFAISGLDGAGKSSQAAALVARLEVLGYPAVSRWTRLSADPSLDAVARPVKRVVRLLRRQPPANVAGDVHPSRVTSPEQRLRQSSRTMTWAWAMVVAASNGLAQRRSTRTHLAAGRSVVCDRWTLDSAVHLRYRYGEDRRFALHVAVIRLLSPRPAATFFLDVPAETAYQRKDDHYDVSQLRRQERLYQEERLAHGALLLDGTRPAEELSDEVLPVALAALARPSRRLAVLRR